MFSGAKGGSSSFKQTPDNLRSNDTFEGVLGLCVGPIKGPTRGLKSIKVDGTAIENETGQLNFQDFTATFGDGDPLKFPQKVQLKLGAGAAPTQVGLSLPNEGGNNPIWITRTLNNRNASFVDLRLIVQQLFRQDAKGIYTATATIEIQMKPTGSATWINPTLGTATATYNENGLNIDGFIKQYVARKNYDSNGNPYQGQSNYVINGKTSSPAVYELRIGLPNEGVYADTGWDIRMRLLERESYLGGKDNADQEKRSISWESMAAVYPDTMGEHEDWRGLSWIQVYGKASDQLTGVPEITGEYDTKLVSVPAANIYNPATRQYTPGVWDGSWAKAYVNDPAWVISDAISDELSGISLIAPGSFLNKWDALDLSKHCSELVPDGNGGLEPRYSMNIAITQPQKAEEAIRYLAGAVGALAWDQGDGEWRVKVDKADAPSDLFTLDNIEGDFMYAHTDVDTRFNDIIGKFKNAEMDYAEDAVQLFDNPSIALLGRKPTTIALVGCTTRQEAMRRVKLRLRASVNENRIVTFTTNRRGRNIEQLSTILIADGDLGDLDKRTTGRTVAVAADRRSIVVRDPMYVAPGVDYKMWFTIPNPLYMPATATMPTSNDWTKPTVSISRNITNTSGQRGTVTTLYLDSPLPDSIADNLSVALEAANLPTMPRLFRVTSVVPADDGERVSISAINIDTGKYAASDNVTKEDTVFQDLRGAVAMPSLVPGNNLLTLIRVPLEQGSVVNLQANWVRPAGAFYSGFRVQYSVNGGALQTAVERQQLAEWELPNAGPGMYHVEISTIDRRGGYSPPLIGELEVTQSLIDATQIKYGTGETLDELKPAQAGADVTGENQAADVISVGGRPVAEVIETIDSTKEQTESNRTALDNLEELFGDTAGAADSAEAARQAQEIAEQAAGQAAGALALAQAAQQAAGDSASQSQAAKNLSVQAQQLSEAARGQAQAAKSAAEQAQTQAKANADAAAVSKSGAEGFATTASGQATIATQQAEGSRQSALTSTAQADLARTRAGEALVSSQRAAASESNAEGSANSALTSSQLSATALTAAQALFNASYPPSLDTVGRKAYRFERPYSNIIGPNLSWPTPLLANWDAADMATMSTQFGVGFSKFVPKVVGRRYRALAWIFSGATNAGFSASWRDFTSEDGAGNRFLGAGLPTAGAVQSVGPTQEGFVRVGAEFVVTDDTQAFLQFYMTIFSINGQPVNGRVHMGPIEFVDITESTKAGVAASAAFESAQSAAASSSSSETKAAASEASRIKAETAQGKAESARDTAVLSEDSARGSASTATDQASLAAQAKTAAGVSAKASSDSAAVAKAHADAAGTSASLSEGSRSAAETAKGLAEGYRNTALSASDSALASKTAAALSEGIAVTAKTAAQALFDAQHPPTLDPAGRSAYILPHSSTSVAGPATPSSGWPQPYITQTSANTVNYETYTRFKQSLPLVIGRKYRVESWIFSYATNVRFFIGLYGGSAADGTQDTQYYGALSPVYTPTTQGFVKLSGEFTMTAGWAPFISPRVVSTSAPNMNNGVFHTTGIVLTDITESEVAKASANAAVGSAQAASASQEDAQQKAEASDASRVKAETAQGKAEIAQAAAALSESNAEGSSQAAATSSNLAATARRQAVSTVASTMPSDFKQGATFWSSQWNGAPDRVAPFSTAWEFNKEGSGTVRWNGGSVGEIDIANLGAYPLTPGRRHRVTVQWRILNTAAARASATIYFIGLTPTWDTALNAGEIFFISGNEPGWGNNTGYHTHTYEVDDNYMLNYGQVAARVLFRFNPFNSSDIFEVRSILVEDITSEKAAGDSATAASSSSSTAQASATAAGLSASASEKSSIAAGTAKGQAESARDTAVTSKDTAVGSAQSAAASAVLSATARGGAEAALARQLPSTLDPAGRAAYNYSGVAIGPSSAWPQPYITESAAGVVTGETYVMFKKNMPRTPGRTYKMRAWGFSYATNVIFFLGLYGSNSEEGGTDVYYGTLSNGGAPFKPSGPGFFEMTGTWNTDSLNLRSFYSPRIIYNVDNGAPNTNTVHLTGIEITDITESKAAEGFATASSQSAASALASSDTAGNYSNTARTYRDAAEAFNGTASTSASNAQTYANQANASSASAASSSLIASSYSSSAVNINDKFGNWVEATSYPYAYSTWVAEGNYSFNRQPGIGSAYAIQTKNDADGATSGFFQGAKVWPGRWVMEATVRLDAGNYQGSGLSINGLYNLNFSTMADSVGDVSISKSGKIRSFSWMFEITQSFIDSTAGNISFHQMHGWPGFGTVAAKYLTWYMVRLRPATQPEIDGNKAFTNAATNAARIENVNTTITNDLGALGRRTALVEASAEDLVARTGINETAIVDINKKTSSARLELTASTPGGRASITLRSDSNAGAGVDIVGDVNFKGNLKIQKTVGGNTITIDSDVGFIITASNGIRVIELVV